MLLFRTGSIWLRVLHFPVILFAAVGILSAQQTAGAGGDSSPAQQADKAFKAGNDLMEQKRPAEALRRYQESLALQPNDTSVLYNAGLAAYLSKNFSMAADFWKQLKALDPDDWRARSKLIQAYQALGKTAERDAERAELIELWKSGKNEDLSKQTGYCREQFEVNATKLMVFENFELKGDRAVRYVFSVLGLDGKEDHWYSLGSYDMTNQVWHETSKPKPKIEERLFHLDGYFKQMHATYAMIAGEPSYDETRAMVVKIIEGELKPKSSSTWGAPAQPDKPKP